MAKKRIAWVTIPWLVPAPVKARNYSSPKGYKQYAVEVDLAKLSTITDPYLDGIKSKDILYSDCQLAGLPPRGLMGSARSGFYRGKYLKGIGRTLLSGHWLNSDYYHASGWLLCSGAIRERVNTAILRAIGQLDLIIPCEAVLLSKLETRVAKTYARVFKGELKSGALKPCDLQLKAISVKSSEIVRPSNLEWLLANRTDLKDFRTLHDFPYLLAIIANQFNIPSKQMDSIRGFESLVKSLESGFARFLIASKIGVHWGSVGNNFTIEGKFLDLETMLYFGQPMLGTFRDSRNASGKKEGSSSIEMGFEVIAYTYSVRELFDTIIAHYQALQASARSRKKHPTLQKAIDQLLGSIRELKKNTPLLSNDSWVVGKISESYKTAMRLTPVQTRIVHQLAEDRWNAVFHGKPGETWAHLAKKTMPLPTHTPEMPFKKKFIEIPEFWPIDLNQMSKLDQIRDLVHELESRRSPSGLSTELSKIDSKIREIL